MKFSRRLFTMMLFRQSISQVAFLSGILRAKIGRSSLSDISVGYHTIDSLLETQIRKYDGCNGSRTRNPAYARVITHIKRAIVVYAFTLQCYRYTIHPKTWWAVMELNHPSYLKQLVYSQSRYPYGITTHENLLEIPGIEPRPTPCKSAALPVMLYPQKTP